MTWEQVCEDKSLQDLPYKIELNRLGQIIMSPTRYKHGFFQSEIASLLKRLLPQGFVVVECAVETSDGTKVADVAWCSPERHQINKEEFSCTIAPEICIEVLSPANSDEEMERKRALYVERGTLEYWVCNEFGRLSFFGRQAALERSELCPAFPVRIES